MKFKETNVPAGLHLRVRHTRAALPEGMRWRTQAALLDPDNKVVAVGFSYCSRKDNPSRKIGRAIAVGRALKDYYTVATV